MSYIHRWPFLTADLIRINIGNARIQGLEKDLHMKGQDYSIALFMFFIPYILLEVPSNILLKKVRPSVWLSGIMFFWGQSSRQSSYPPLCLLTFPFLRHHHGLPGSDSVLRWTCHMSSPAWRFRGRLLSWCYLPHLDVLQAP